MNKEYFEKDRQISIAWRINALIRRRKLKLKLALNDRTMGAAKYALIVMNITLKSNHRLYRFNVLMNHYYSN